MDGLFGLDSVSPHDDSMELLKTVHDNVELAIIRSILDGEKIPYMIKERGSGSVVKIIAGFSMYGTDIFVPKSVLEDARAMIQPVPDDEATDGDEFESDK